MADNNVMNESNGGQSGNAFREQMEQESASRRQANQNQQADEYDEDEDVFGEEEEPAKSKINLKIILPIAGVCAVVALIVVMVTSGSKRQVEPEIPYEPADEIPIVFDPIIEEEETVPVIMANYTADQMNMLRSIGITSEEITDYMQNNVPYDYVYNTLMEQYWGWHLMNELPTYDMTSDSYKDVINQTWMSLPERHDLAEWTTEYSAYSYDVEANLDYEKVTPYGNQLFLKIYLDDNTHDSWFFLNIRPEEWNMLGPKGNVVVNYTYQTHYKPYENIFDAEEDKDNIFIISASLNIIKSDFAITGGGSAGN